MSYSPDINEFPDRFEESKKPRIPPGQHEVKGFPVLSINSIPSFDGENWNFVVDGLVENPITWSWNELCKLPKTIVTTDFHCVTGWSRLDLQWAGISIKTIVDIVKPLSNAHYITSYGPEDYTSSLPFEDYMYDSDVLIAYELENKPLDPDHGGPLRLLVPKIYAYKSTKWLTKLTFTEKWERGFWEKLGYHQRADPWLDERYSSQEKIVKKKRLEIEKAFKKSEREQKKNI
jgi:DMSO/TMAO reductase YedYZ molybdopterin-dependent catalytic subunit